MQACNYIHHYMTDLASMCRSVDESSLTQLRKKWNHGAAWSWRGSSLFYSSLRTESLYLITVNKDVMEIVTFYLAPRHYLLDHLTFRLFILYGSARDHSRMFIWSSEMAKLFVWTTKIRFWRSSLWKTSCCFLYIKFRLHCTQKISPKIGRMINWYHPPSLWRYLPK